MYVRGNKAYIHTTTHPVNIIAAIIHIFTVWVAPAFHIRRAHAEIADAGGLNNIFRYTECDLYMAG